MAVGKERLVAFPYFGGKNSHLDWLLPLLPEGPSVEHYCEPFGGSAAVLLNRSPAPVETYNDLDDNLVNFFRVLRSKQGAKLIQQLRLTPYSRMEFAAAQQARGLSDLERARQFYVVVRQGFRHTSTIETSGRWSHAVHPGGGKIGAWTNGIAALMGVIERLHGVQIEHHEAVYCLKTYDDRHTLFYCDPPYDPGVCTPAYKHVLSWEQIEHFLETARACKGRVAISAYASPRMDKVLKGWRCVKAKVRYPPMTNNQKKDKQQRQEVLYTNYDPHPRRLF